MVTLVPDTMDSNWVVMLVAALSVVAAVPASPSQARPTTGIAFVTPGIRSSSTQNYPDNLVARGASSRCPLRGSSTPRAESAARLILSAGRRQGTSTSCTHHCDVAESGDYHDSAQESSPLDQTIEEPQGSAARQRQRQLLIFRTVPPLLLAATTACSQASIAAVTGGRIGGGGYTAPDRAPSAAPPMQQQQRRYEAPTPQQYSPRAGRDIYGSDGSRTHIKFSYGGRAGRRGGRARFNPDVGDVTSTSITPGDVVMIGGVSAGLMAAQRYNRKRFLEDGAGSPGVPPPATRSGVGGGGTGSSRETSAVTTLQLSTYCDRGGGRRDLLATLDKLSQTADVSGPLGLSALVNEVCLTLLRSEREWIGAAGGIKEYAPDGRGRPKTRDKNKAATPRSRAKRDFNRAAMRERSKWERETVSNTPERGFSSSTVPGWRRGGSDGGGGGGGGDTADGTYAVVTLLVAWSGLRSTPPQPNRRRNPWFWQDGGSNNSRDGDRDSGFSVFNRNSALALLEWLGDEAAEGRGENILDVEVLWTPADPDDSLDRDDLDAKWPELIRL